MPIISGSSGVAALSGVSSFSGTAQSGYQLVASSATAAAWQAVSAGAATLLSTTTVGVGGGTIDVSGISGAYNDLELVLIVRGTNAAINEQIKLNLNNDTGSNYTKEFGELSGTTPSLGGGQVLVSTTIGACRVPGNNGLANNFGGCRFYIPGYAATTWNKVVLWQSFGSYDNSTNDQVVQVGGGIWVSTAAITRVTFAGVNTANLAQNSVLRIYGIT